VNELKERQRKAFNVLNEAYFSIVGNPEKDKRKKCWACNERLDKGESRIFKHPVSAKNGIVLRSKGSLFCKNKKDCKEKASWAKYHKLHQLTIKGIYEGMIK
jgi:hypothetical protein